LWHDFAPGTGFASTQARSDPARTGTACNGRQNFSGPALPDNAKLARPALRQAGGARIKEIFLNFSQRCICLFNLDAS